jgi:DNA-directed RNA polymerase subunit D
MDIKLIKKDEKLMKTSLELKKTNATFANMLRRYIIEKVPTMAIEDVEIKDNSSILYDEIIGHRLGLVPLTTDLKSYFMITECKCEGEGCNRCSVKLTLKGEGPGIVVAGDLKSKDPKIKAVYPKMPIVKLLKGQKIELLATAVLNSGSDHIKFSPGNAYYQFEPDVKIVKQPKNVEEVIEGCPLNIFESKNNALTINKDNLKKCHLCNECMEICNPKGSIEVEPKEDILFSVEEWGQLSSKQMVLSALGEFSKELTQFEEEIKK